MAISKDLIASIFLLCLVLVHQVESQRILSNGGVASSNIPRINCGGACAARCGLSKRPNLCQRICGTCCFRCNCVPPGTYGNFAACPCYASLTTRNNKRKCP
ncbi:snakin-2-like [Henckelia pumila]|uniref:snakin-2-like n=1 Tax=Henckelia pumila TaxID=405737 RepID=UPI003C6E389B